jgi:hypothetical protein
VRFRRGDRLPDDVRDSLPTEPGERVLAAGRGEDDSWVVATDRALVDGDRRTAWTDVTHAQWYDEDKVLAVDLLPGTGSSFRLRLTDPRMVPETVRERVMDSIVASRRLPLPGGGGARMVARRGEGSDEMIWQVIADAGTDLADSDTRARVDAALADLQAELG